MKIYNKPELNVEKFDVLDVITANGSTPTTDADNDNGMVELSAGLEFDIGAAGNEF